MAIHATDFLSDNDAVPNVPVMALFGAERFLKLEVLNLLDSENDDDAASVTRVAGKDADLRSVTDELLTISMFGGKRVVLIEEADEFVSANRPGLEKYVSSPSMQSLLLLDVKQWQKTTRLFKAVEKVGLNIECSQLSGAALVKWFINTAKKEHGKKIDKEAAQLVVELAGDSLGLLQQELNKLVALVGEAEEITTDDVSRVVGGWRLQTTWAMLDAVRDGDVGTALEFLDKLLLAGDPPQKIMGGLVFTWRKFAEATEVARQSRDLAGALRSAGIHGGAQGPAERYLKRIGFDRASKLLQELVRADANMKGGSRIDPKLQLEALFVRLAGAA